MRKNVYDFTGALIGIITEDGIVINSEMVESILLNSDKFYAYHDKTKRPEEDSYIRRAKEQSKDFENKDWWRTKKELEESSSIESKKQVSIAGRTATTEIDKSKDFFEYARRRYGYSPYGHTVQEILNYSEEYKVEQIQNQLAKIREKMLATNVKIEFPIDFDIEAFGHNTRKHDIRKYLSSTVQAKDVVVFDENNRIKKYLTMGWDQSEDRASRIHDEIIVYCEKDTGISLLSAHSKENSILPEIKIKMEFEEIEESQEDAVKAAMRRFCG